MKYDPEKHHRRSIRLRGYDYSQPGGYFITLCTQNRACLFGNVLNGKMAVNDAGRTTQQWYIELGNKFPDIQCDECIVMPNHFHAIIINVGADLCVCPDLSVYPNQDEHADSLGEHIGSPLPKIMQWLKTMTTNAYIAGVKNQGWKSFEKNYGNAIIGNTSFEMKMN